MGRFARIVLVLLALTLVFAPRALTATTHDGPQLLTAAVLAPATGDGDAVSPAREREAASTLVVLATVVAALLVVPAPSRRRRGAAVAVAVAAPDDPRPRRRGPPRSFA
jgi:hypothetical protein